MESVSKDVEMEAQGEDLEMEAQDEDSMEADVEMQVPVVQTMEPAVRPRPRPPPVETDLNDLEAQSPVSPTDNPTTPCSPTDNPTTPCSPSGKPYTPALTPALTASTSFWSSLSFNWYTSESTLDVRLGSTLTPTPKSCPIVGDSDLEVDFYGSEKPPLSPGRKDTVLAQRLYEREQRRLAKLQAREDLRASKELERQERQRQKRLRQERAATFWDPLWGESRTTGSPFHDTVASSCPCCVVGCMESRGRRAWLRFVCSWSTSLVIMQTMVLVCAVLYGGLAPFKMNPLVGPRYETLNIMGAKNAARIIYNHEWWRLFSPIMLHSGLVHLLCNAAVQLRTGTSLEAMWGSLPYILVYVGSGTFGMLTSCIGRPDALGVGASGALCGMLSAWGVFILITWDQTSPVDKVNRNVTVISVAVSVVVTILLSFLPLMDIGGHGGGLTMGVSIAMAVFAGRIQRRLLRYVIGSMGLLLCIAQWAAAFVWFLKFTHPDKALLVVK